MKLSIEQFRKETQKGRVNSFKNIATNAARAKFNSLKLSLIEQFEAHKVTQEIEMGEQGTNISNTLKGLRGGGEAQPNLFSFLGFTKGQKPIDTVREALELLVALDEDYTVDEYKSKISFRYKIRVPSLETLYAITPLPWENGNSWLKGIEKGVSGFTHYIYWKIFSGYPPSRSTTGVQTENVLRSGSFTPVVYITKILNDFIKRAK